MPLPEAAAAHYASQKRIAHQTTNRVLNIWATIDPTRLSGSWQALAQRVFVEVSVGQLNAAAAADPYLDAVLAEQGINIDRSASVTARSFAGIASDGRSLDTLLLEPVIATKVALAKGATLADGLQVGQASIAKIVGTQIVDAGRVAVGTAMVARPAVTSWTRYLSPPSCSRCTVLAGRVYRFNQGFRRHPRCDCQHAPTSEVFADELTTDARAYFDSLSTAEQDQTFTAKGAQQIRNGADIGRVVNTRQRSGLSTASAKASGAARPMPEQIFEGVDRETAIAALLRLGFLT